MRLTALRSAPALALVAVLAGALPGLAPATAAPTSPPAYELVETYETPGLETELSGIFPHPTDNDLYYVVTNGKPPYKPTMTPMLDTEHRNKLLVVHKSGGVREVVDLPDGGGLFGDIAFGGGYLWLGPLDPPELWKVDPANGEVVAKYSLPGPAGGLDYDPERDVVYVHNYIGHPHIAVIDPDSGAVVNSLWSDENCQGMAFVDGDLLTVWTSSWEPDAYTELWRLDPETGRPSKRMAFEGIHAGMAPLDPRVAGYRGFMTLVHVDSGVTGKTRIHRYRYRGSRQDAKLTPPAATPRRDRFAALAPPETGDAAERARQLATAVADAARTGSRYVVLPELTLTARTPPTSGEPIPGPTSRLLARLAQQWRVWIAGSLAERTAEGDGHHVTSILVGPDGTVESRVRKRVLRPNGDDGDATVGFARWLLDSVDDEGRRIGVLPGDDLHAGVPRLAHRGADAILVTANWAEDDPVDWRRQAADLAERFQVNLVVANRDPAFNAVHAPGGAPAGESIAASGAGLVAEVPVANANWRPRGALGLPSVPVPTYLPFTPALVGVGETLFFDTGLSSSGEIACASCHEPELAFTDGRVFGRGVEGRETRRNVPSVLNAAFRVVLQWDGNPTTLEQQVKYPLNGHAELDMRRRADVARYVAERPGLMAELRRALGLPADARVGSREITLALAAFQRTLVSGGSPFDRHVFAGEPDALDAAQRRGLRLFSEEAGCAACHTIGRREAHFTDGRFHTLGIGYVAEREAFADPGVGTVSSADYAGMFFTPSLRNVALTAPYLHDGSARTLRAAIERHYAIGDPLNRGDPAQPRPDARPSEREIDDLVAFLHALTGPGASRPVPGHASEPARDQRARRPAEASAPR